MDILFNDVQHVYIHWPFCPYKCHFCDFVAMASHEQFMKSYHDSLSREIDIFQARVLLKKPLNTVYIGGGTPSTYPPEWLLDMVCILKSHFELSNDVEFTIEVNPGTVTTKHFIAWKEAGINRLSIGVQSLKDQVLKSLNRHQSAQDVQNVLQEASEHFENISVDFILGLPGVLDEEWKLMIEHAMTWPITHISIYFLMVHENTPLYFKVKTNKMSLPPDDKVVDLYHWAVEKLSQHGFERYEISNFAKKGFSSKHNQAYWDRKQYCAFGLGACGFNGKIRFQNQKNLGIYLEKLSQGVSPVDQIEVLTPDQILIEKIMLGLRQAKGLDLNFYLKDLSVEKQHVFLNNIKELEKIKLVNFQNNILQLTPQGFVLENEVSLRLFPD